MLAELSKKYNIPENYWVERDESGLANLNRLGKNGNITQILRGYPDIAIGRAYGKILIIFRSPMLSTNKYLVYNSRLTDRYDIMCDDFLFANNKLFIQNIDKGRRSWFLMHDNMTDGLWIGDFEIVERDKMFPHHLPKNVEAIRAIADDGVEVVFYPKRSNTFIEEAYDFGMPNKHEEISENGEKQEEKPKLYKMKFNLEDSNIVLSSGGKVIKTRRIFGLEGLQSIFTSLLGGNSGITEGTVNKLMTLLSLFYGQADMECLVYLDEYLKSLEGDRYNNIDSVLDYLSHSWDSLNVQMLHEDKIKDTSIKGFAWYTKLVFFLMHEGEIWPYIIDMTETKKLPFGVEFLQMLNEAYELDNISGAELVFAGMQGGQVEQIEDLEQILNNIYKNGKIVLPNPVRNGHTKRLVVAHKYTYDFVSVAQGTMGIKSMSGKLTGDILVTLAFCSDIKMKDDVELKKTRWSYTLVKACGVEFI